MIVNKNLQVINSQKETSKIKSGCFDDLNSFVYSTSTHIKYMFLEGKTTGTFKSIDQPVYVTFVSFHSLLIQIVHEKPNLCAQSQRWDRGVFGWQYRLLIQASPIKQKSHRGQRNPEQRSAMRSIDYLLPQRARIQRNCSILRKRPETEV